MAADKTSVAEIDVSIAEQPIRATPEEEYLKGRKRRRKVIALLALLFAFDCLVCVVLWKDINRQDLLWRVGHQVENNLFGKVTLETGEYVGETDFGYFSGSGTFEYRDGSSYDGGWLDNNMEGLGKLNTPDKGVYEGSFSNSLKDGNGTFVWSDGDCYTGEWKNDQMSGQGKYVCSDGAEYTGLFKGNALWQGKCVFNNSTGSYEATYKDGKVENLAVTFSDGSSYEGSCVAAGNITGTGAMKYVNGDSFEGDFQNGKRDGSGVYTWVSGDKYDGSWVDDSMQGSGTYTYSNGCVAQGQFSNNQFVDGSYEVSNAFGKYAFKVKDKEVVSVSMNLTDGTAYSGDIVDGKLTGSAQIVYGNGDKYSGSVDCGRKSGSGTYSWSNGASYEGNWENDKMSGSGTYTYPSGEAGYKLVGAFSDGRPNGECQYYTDSSKHYKTDWENGKCVKVYE